MSYAYAIRPFTTPAVAGPTANLIRRTVFVEDVVLGESVQLYMETFATGPRHKTKDQILWQERLGVKL